MMKFILASAIAAIAYGTTPTRDLVGTSAAMYVKMNLHCANLNDIDAATPETASLCVVDTNTDGNGNTVTTIASAGHIEATIKAQFLMRANYDIAQGFGNHAGNCLNYLIGVDGASQADFGVGAVANSSFYLVRHATDDTVTVWKGAPGCSGAVATTATGFLFGDAATQGKWAVGGDIAGLSTKNTWGLELGATNMVNLFTASRWTGKKNFAFQIIGPYADNSCKGLTLAHAATIFYPVVVPLEDAVRNDVVTAPASTTKNQSEFALSTTMRCWNVNSLSSAANGTNAGEAEWHGVKTTANLGEFTWAYSSGALADREVDTAGTTTCTPGALYYGVTFKMDYSGKMSTNKGACIQAKDAAGEDVSSKFFRMIPAIDQVGAWPTSQAIPSTACDACTGSPASGLHFSAAVAAFIALFNMLM